MRPVLICLMVWIAVKNPSTLWRMKSFLLPLYFARIGTRWVHIGTHETYIALGESRVEPAKRWTPYQGLPGLNHLAYEVDDVEALRNRMEVGRIQRLHTSECTSAPQAHVLLRARGQRLGVRPVPLSGSR